MLGGKHQRFQRTFEVFRNHFYKMYGTLLEFYEAFAIQSVLEAKNSVSRRVCVTSFRADIDIEMTSNFQNDNDMS